MFIQPSYNANSYMFSPTASPDQVLNTIGQTQTGSSLLNQALNNGVSINFAPDNGDNVKGYFNPDNNSITVESGTLEEMVETLSHELLHASTPENGNSMQEEFSAFMVGEKVASEAGVNANPHSADFWANHVNSAYANDGLPADNGIAGNLASLGIDLGLGGTSIPGMSNPFGDGGSTNIAGLGNTGGSDIFGGLGNIAGPGNIGGGDATAFAGAGGAFASAGGSLASAGGGLGNIGGLLNAIA